MLILQIQAKEHGITPAVIASKKQIANMIQAGENHLADDWHGALVNEPFEAYISGEKVLRVANGKVVLETP